MSDLTINAMDLPVRAETVSCDLESVGASGRAEDGSAWSSVSSTKRVWKFRTPPLATDVASAWAGFLNGGLLHFPYEADMYSTDGLPIATNPGTLASLSSTYVKYGTYALKILNGGAPTWKTRFGATWSLRTWRRESTSFYLYVVGSDGVVYKNNVLQGAGVPAWMSLVAGTLTLSGDGDRWYDDTVASPFLIPASWISGSAGPWSYSGAAVYPTVPPVFSAAGDMMPSGGVTIVGRAKSAALLALGGAHYQQLDVELVEV